MDRYAVVSSRAAAEFHNLPAPVRAVLKLCDGTRTLQSISEQSALPLDRAEHVLRRLVSLGVVALQAESAKPRQRKLTPQGISWLTASAPQPQPEPEPQPEPGSVFSDDEERFFASPIDHLIEDF